MFLISRFRDMIRRSFPVLIVLSVSCGGQQPLATESSVARLENPEHRVDTIPGRYLVAFKPNANRDILNDARDLVALEKGILRKVFRPFQGFSAELSDSAVRHLRGRTDIRFIEPDVMERVVAGTQYPTPSWGLDRIDQYYLSLDQSYTYGVDGAGVRVYHLDSGIFYPNPDFGGRAILGADLVTPGGTGLDCFGHGTWTAGALGSATYGVAKAVTLIAVRVVPCSNEDISRETLIDGISWVTENAIRPAIVSYSIRSTHSEFINWIVGVSVSSGLTWVVAAGNDNSDACDYSPAGEASAITVAASTNLDWRWIATPDTASNYGSCVDIFAPGSLIPTTGISGTVLASGTSIATPFVAGAAALYLQTHPSATPAEIDAALKGGGYPYVVSNAGAYTTQRLLNIEFMYPNPSVLPVTITGKSSIKADQLCTWHANVQGGPSGLEYRWYFAGQVFHLSLTDSVRVVLPNTGQLSVVVSSPGGSQVGNAVKTVTVSPSGSYCTT